MHFYNLSLENALDMDSRDYFRLVQAMQRVKARDWLQTFELNCVPKMNEKNREKVRKRLYKQAYPDNFKKDNVAKNLNDLVTKLRSGLNG